MNDLTFIFPVRIDCQERLENINANVNYLRMLYINPKIIINEDGSVINIPYVKNLKCNNGEFFYKTKMINDAVRAADTDLVAIIDADLFFSKDDYDEAYLKVKNNEADFSFSYSGECWNYKRSFLNFIKTNVITRGTQYPNHMLECMNRNSIGGSIWCSKKTFFEVGGQNEKMLSWGFEDNEFYNRILKLEKKLHRTSGITYHLQHPRGINSSDLNPNLQKNQDEYNRIISMDKISLQEEVKTWKK